MPIRRWAAIEALAAAFGKRPTQLPDSPERGSAYYQRKGLRPELGTEPEQALASGGYIAGEQFSAADVYVGSHIGWGLQFGST